MGKDRRHFQGKGRHGSAEVSVLAVLWVQDQMFDSATMNSWTSLRLKPITRLYTSKGLPPMPYASGEEQGEGEDEGGAEDNDSSVSQQSKRERSTRRDPLGEWAAGPASGAIAAASLCLFFVLPTRVRVRVTRMPDQSFTVAARP